MPFGLTNSHTTYQRLLEQLCISTNVCFIWMTLLSFLPYFLPSLDEHISHLEAVIRRSQEFVLRLKSCKCHFLWQEVCYFGSHCVWVKHWCRSRKSCCSAEVSCSQEHQWATKFPGLRWISLKIHPEVWRLFMTRWVTWIGIRLSIWCRCHSIAQVGQWMVDRR